MQSIQILERVKGLLQRGDFVGALSMAEGSVATLHADEQGDLRRVIKAITLVSGLRSSFDDLHSGRLDVGFAKILEAHTRHPRGCIVRGIASTSPIGESNNREAFGRAVPLWDGQTVGRLLIFCDGGIGDILQFARYVNAARQKCEHLTVAAPSPLLGFLSKNLSADELIPYDRVDADFPDTFREADAHASIYIIPGALKISDYGAVPYLSAEPAFVPPLGRKQVGLCWSCSPEGQRDGRAAKLSDFAAFADLEDIDFHSLVPGHGADWMQIYNPVDYESTARVVASLDIVITVDTGIAHLSGGMGKPTWIMTVSDEWRWETHPTDSKWYPTATLYRKQPGESWAALVQKAIHNLTA